MDCDLFDVAADRLEHHTPLDRLEARGTLRIALKVAGLEPKELKAWQLRVVLEKVLPKELEQRGVSDPTTICTAVMGEVTRSWSAPDTPRSGDPDEIFRRLGGD